MEIQISIPTGCNELLLAKYPDASWDSESDGHTLYTLGSDESDDWLSEKEATAACGWIEGAIIGAETLVEGNGPWAQSQLHKTAAYTGGFKEGKSHSASTFCQKGGNLGGFKLLRGPLAPGQCAECAVVHDPGQPHNQQSLFYQYSFREHHGRWPTWTDALAHCSKEVQTAWKTELSKLGIEVPSDPKTTDPEPK